MRVPLGSILLIVVVASCQSSAAQQPFSITISAEQAQVKVGSSVNLKIQMTNTSNRELNCGGAPSNGLDRAYRYDVRDENGKAVPKIAKKHPEIGETFGVWPCSIKPGETASAAGGLISVLYDLTRPGRYTIQVSRPVSEDDPKSPVIYSNKVTITIIQ